MKDDLKEKLDNLSIPDPSANFENRIMRAGFDISKATRANRNAKSIWFNLIDAIGNFNHLRNISQPYVAVCLFALITIAVIKISTFGNGDRELAKTTLITTPHIEDPLDDFNLFDEEEFLFEPEWIL
jgi:hypothetical protein